MVHPFINEPSHEGQSHMTDQQFSADLATLIESIWADTQDPAAWPQVSPVNLEIAFVGLRSALLAYEAETGSPHPIDDRFPDLDHRVWLAVSGGAAEGEPEGAWPLLDTQGAEVARVVPECRQRVSDSYGDDWAAKELLGWLSFGLECGWRNPGPAAA